MRTEIYGTRGSVVQRNVNQGYQFEGWLYTEENGALYDQKLARSLRKALASAERVARYPRLNEK